MLDEELRQILSKNFNFKTKKITKKLDLTEKYVKIKKKMNLRRTVQEENLLRIRDLAESKNISANNKWLDYEILKCAIKSKKKDIAKFLLDRGCRVNKTTTLLSRANTPLHCAVMINDIDIVYQLLTNKASAMIVDSNGNTPLHLAFMQQNMKMVEMLLPFSIDYTNTNPVNLNGLSHLHIACASNCSLVVHGFLATGVNVNKAVNHKSSFWPGYTPLHFAIKFQSSEVVKILLNANADPHAKDTYGFTPSDLARHIYQEASLIDHLVSSSSDTTVKDRISNFHAACLKDDAVIVKRFLEFGVSVDDTVSQDAHFCPLYSPLHFAVESNDPAKVRLLLDYGACVEHQDVNYQSPLHLALYNEPDPEAPNATGILDLLYSKLESRKVERSDLNGLSHLHLACSRNDVDAVTELLNAGLDVDSQLMYNLRNYAHYTTLHFAVQFRAQETVQLLLDRGARVNCSDNGMRGAPLHLAVEAAQPEILDVLLRAGARADVIRPIDDKTALHLLVELLHQTDQHDAVGAKGRRIQVMRQQAVGLVERLCELGCDVNHRDAEGNTALHLVSASSNIGSELTTVLLHQGADVELENDSGETALDVAVPRHFDLLYEHVQQLSVLGLKVTWRTEKRCMAHRATMPLQQRRESSRKWLGYDAEAQRLRNRTIDGRTSLLQLLFERPRRLAEFCRNNSLRKLVESRSFDKQFPIFGYLVKLQYRRGMRSVREDKLNGYGDRADDARVKRRRLNH